MAIEENEYVKYDQDKHFYYLTEAGAVEYTGKDNIPNMWKNPSWRLKNMAELLYDDYTFSVYNYKKLRYRNIDHTEYNIFKNEKGEREAIVRALTLFAIAADDYDLDIDIMAGEKEMPERIRKPMRRAGIYFRGEYTGFIEEDEWRVGY